MIPAIQIEHVVKRYGRLTALDDVSLNIEQAEFFGLLVNRAWIDEVLHHLDLTAKADTKTRQLSGGACSPVMADAVAHQNRV